MNIQVQIYICSQDRIEDAENNEIRYHLDPNGNYVVPKRRIEDVVCFL